MKSIFTMIFISALSFFSQAQNVGVKVDNVDASENTTIEIKKGQKSADKPLYEITQGEENIEGEAAPLLKEARNNHKKACQDWKKEFRELNKSNEIISMSCGSQSCSTQAMETICVSKASYKLKVKVN